MPNLRLALALVIGLPLAVPARAVVWGAADRMIIAHENIPGPEAVRIAADDAGDVFAAVPVLDPVDGGEVHVRVSRDGGDTWTEWAAFTDNDGNAATGYFDPSLVIVNAPVPVVHLALRHDYLLLGTPFHSIEVGEANSAFVLGSFTFRTALSTSGVSFRQPDLAFQVGSFQHLFVAAAGSDGNGDDIWFTRSIDGGVTWEPGYRIASSSVLLSGYRLPRVAAGFGHVVHVAYEFSAALGNPPQSAIYRRAFNDAANGLSDWQPAITVASGDRAPVVAASPTGDQVTVASHDPTLGVVHTRDSATQGATFGASTLTLGGSEPASLAWSAPATAMAIASERFDRVNFATGTTALIPNLALSDGVFADDAENRAAITQSAKYASRAGVAWVHTHGAGPDTAWFDADWRGVGSFPSHGAHSPLAVPSRPVTPPTLANLDEDPELEIVWGDAAGLVHVLDPDLSEKAGWPRPIGAFPAGGAIAVGDVDGDGHAEVLTGSAAGILNVFRANGVPLAGFPKAVGPGSAAYVSMGDVLAGGGDEAVACAGNQVHVLRADGSEAPGFPVFTVANSVASAPAAIGDPTGVARPSLVVHSDHTVRVIDGSGAVTMLVTLPVGATFHTAPALADLDGDGDLEIVSSSDQGGVWAHDHDGTLAAGMWPFTVASGQSVFGVTLARFVGDPHPSVVFDEPNGVVHRLAFDGTPVPGWPQQTIGGAVTGVAPVIDELDGFTPGVVMGAGDGRLYGWAANGADLFGFPKPMGSAVRAMVATGDVDADGLVEIVVLAEGSVSVLHVPQLVRRTDPKGQWPMYGSTPEHDFCLDCRNNPTTGAPGEAAASLRLASPQPNPSRGPVRLAWAQPRSAVVELAVLDVQGRVVRVLESGVRGAGAHAAAWDGSRSNGDRAGDGVYFARLVAAGPGGREVAVRRLVRMR